MLSLNSKPKVSHQALLAFMLIVMLSMAIKADEPPILLLAEASPFTLKADNTGNGGEASAFIERLLNDSQLDYQLRFEPWKRAYLKAQTSTNVLIYPIARGASREEQFQWIGQLIPVTYYLFRLTARTDISINSLEDAKKWRIGVVNEHIHHQHLKDRSFTNFQPVNSNYQNVQKALLGRIELFPMSDGGMMQLCNRGDINCSSFKPVLKLDGISNGLYLAASNDSDEVMIEKLIISYQSLVNSGQHEKILRQRLLRIEEFNQRWPNVSLAVDLE